VFRDLAGHHHFATLFDIGSADAGLADAILALDRRTSP